MNWIGSLSLALGPRDIDTPLPPSLLPTLTKEKEKKGGGALFVIDTLPLPCLVFWIC